MTQKCKCGHDKSEHPREPCIHNWRDERIGCKCPRFTASVPEDKECKMCGRKEGHHFSCENRHQKGCGKEVCGVQTREDLGDRYGKEDVDISYCGGLCFYHKKIHLCPECKPQVHSPKPLLLNSKDTPEGSAYTLPSGVNSQQGNSKQSVALAKSSFCVKPADNFNLSSKKKLIRKILKFVNFPKEDNKILSDWLHKLAGDDLK